MDNWGSIIFSILDTLIKVLLPVVAGYAINYFREKVGREKFMLAQQVVTSIVASLEQQYRSGEIPKDDRFALAMEQGIKRTGLSEEQVSQLIKESVFQINAGLKKYDYPNTSPGFEVQGPTSSVSSTVEQPMDTVAEGQTEQVANMTIRGSKV
jgi:hypothetical protein